MSGPLLRLAAELFVCGTTMDVTPLVRLGGRPGPVARAPYEGLLERMAGPVPAAE